MVGDIPSIDINAQLKQKESTAACCNECNFIFGFSLLGLCDKMWGDAFYYEESDINCMVMQFDPVVGEHPNLMGNPYNKTIYSGASRISGLLALNFFVASTLFGIWSL